MKLTVEWIKDSGEMETQKKTFADESKATEFCRRNHEHIFSINGVPTLGEQI